MQKPFKNLFNNKFWNLESASVSKNQIDVCENFQIDISFANKRYGEKLPFRSEHDMLDENVLLCKSRLKICLTTIFWNLEGVSLTKINLMFVKILKQIFLLQITVIRKN